MRCVRLDKGNTILGQMNVKLDQLDNLDQLNQLGKLDYLDVISSKLDTLPEKIAEAIKR